MDPIPEGHVGHTGPVYSVCANDTWMFSGSQDKTIIAWSVSGDLQILEGHTGGVKTVCVSDDGQFLFSGSYDKTIKVWHIIDETWQLHKTLEGHTEEVESVCVSRDKLFSGSHDRTIKVWVETGACVHTWENLSGSVNSVCLSVDGSRLFLGDGDTKIKELDMSGTCIQTLEGHHRAVLSVCVSGSRLFSGSVDWTIKVWNLKTGACLRTLIGHRDTVMSVCVLGSQLFSGGRDKTLRVWDLEVGRAVGVFDAGAYVNSVCVMPEDDNPNYGTLFAACWDCKVRYWDCDDDSPWLVEIPNKRTPYVSLRF